MSTPTVIHVVRPYASEDEYLACEAWTIDARGMLLIDQPALVADTALVFDVALQTGHKPIRAEAKVVGAVPPAPGRPGGLRIRFKRYGTATKAFIDRAVALAQPAPSAPATAAPTVAAAPEPAPGQNVSVAAPTPATMQSVAIAERREPSGIHRKLVAPVAPPANREELLEKLRERARSAGQAAARRDSERTG